MLDIGEVRQEFATSMANSLMNGRMHVLQACVDIHFFATRTDIDASTLAIASQVDRELRARRRSGDNLSKDAKKFLKHYESASRRGRSIFFAPRSRRKELIEQAHEHGAFRPARIGSATVPQT